MSQVTSKASEGLTKVTSSASESAGSGASGTASQGRMGRMVSSVQCKLCNPQCVSIVTENVSPIAMIPPAVYYSRVGLELAKLVFQGQKMSPP